MSSQPTSAYLPSPAASTAASFGREESPELGQELRRLLTGLALAGLYGLALGARSGGTSLLRHALGAPAAVLTVGAIVVPSLFVILSLFDAPISLAGTVSASARAAASTGLVLAGLAPATALLVVTIDSPWAASFVVQMGLLMAGALGGLPLLRALHAELVNAPLATRLKSRLVLLGFAVFGLALSARMTSALLPILGGGA